MLASRMRLVVGSFCVLVLTGYALQMQAEVKPIASPAYLPELPRGRGLDANLFMQTSAEYRAGCYQAYNFALLRLNDTLAKRNQPNKPPAIVMDLDETVFDNAGFQASQLRSGLAYENRLWDDWEKNHSQHIGLVPGARRFILEATKKGVTVVYISNRSHEYLQQSKDALKRFEIPLRDDSELKLFKGTNTSKKERIDEVKANYDLLLIVGDNLRDFDDRFKCPPLSDPKTPESLESAIQARKDQVDQTESAFGDRWIILPNPAYGEWTKPLGLGDQDYDRLVKPEKKM